MESDLAIRSVGIKCSHSAVEGGVADSRHSSSVSSLGCICFVVLGQEKLDIEARCLCAHTCVSMVCVVFGE